MTSGSDAPPRRPDGFRGIFRTDADARAVYSESAGIARAYPRAIAVPADIDDAQTLVRWARATGTPLIPRGSGSSMPNGAIGDGVIVDMSRMRDIGEIDTARKRVTVGPGAIVGDIDTAARAHGLRFPPDPSSVAFCSAGGIVSTNAAGAHTLGFGATRKWVAALDCIFDDGSRARRRTWRSHRRPAFPPSSDSDPSRQISSPRKLRVRRCTPECARTPRVTRSMTTRRAESSSTFSSAARERSCSSSASS